MLTIKLLNHLDSASSGFLPLLAIRVITFPRGETESLQMTRGRDRPESS